MKKTVFLLAVLVMISTSACSTKRSQNTATSLPPQSGNQSAANDAGAPPATSGTTTSAAKVGNALSPQENQAGKGGAETIYFAYDSYLTTEEAKNSLAGTSELLKKNPELTLTIAGHCDERGSEMYNIALGEKRAQSAKNYLVTLGNDPERLETVSYGEERPAAQGASEEAWGLNRRVDFN